MNKRDFLLGTASSALATAALAAPADATAAVSSTSTSTTGAGWLGRTQRQPDLAAARADRFEPYVGETFATRDATLRLAAVTRQPGCARTEQFSLRFDTVEGATPATGTHVLEHATGQRLALHLEAVETGASAHFSLLV
jgi:hypothetical protein